jgi:ribonuclease HI
MGNGTIRVRRQFRKTQRNKVTNLADFVAEWTEPLSVTEGKVLETQWVAYCDRAWGAAAILLSPSGIKLRYAARIQFNKESDMCTNNVAEYEAMLLGPRKLRAIRVQKCILCTDSKVVTGQIEKECIAREPTLEKYLGLVKRMDNYFKGFTEEYNERNKNGEADELAKAAARNTPRPAYTFFQVLKDASVKIVLLEPRNI